MNDSISSNFLQPFLINDSHVRGRVVRLGEVMDTILSRHNYPEPVSQLLGETLMIAALLAANLKHEGIFTIQAKGDGPISMLVVDAVQGGELRGYAELKDESELGRARLEKECDDRKLSTLLGEGYLAITLDPGAGGQRYQGIVELSGDTIRAAVEHYFANSQQLDVAIRLAVMRNIRDGKGLENAPWHGGAIMIERLPDESALEGGDIAKAQMAQEKEEWNNAYILMDSVESSELLDVSLSPEQLLYRLYNESGVWVYDANTISVGCRCSRERISEMLSSLSDEDITDMTVDGRIEITCQFCVHTEVFAANNDGIIV